MEQAELRKWEHKCIQEETPQCTAACPLHVDARTFCSLMGQRRWDKAWSVLARTLPLPGVLARLCDAPCRNECVRKDAGGGIEIGLLERFCADNAKPVPPPRPLPSRGKSTAVLGGDLAGLCATWELARRGFDVTLYCTTPGKDLLGLPQATLPEGVLERELENLAKLGAKIESDRAVDEALLNTALEEKDAVFLASDALAEALSDLGDPDELTLGTGRSGLFAAPRGETSPILKAAAGRRAANSMERFTQGVSLVANRELEGPYKTRLYTNIAGEEPAPPVIPDGGYNEVEARDEAKRCLQCECMECVKNCEYLKHFKSYPKVYVRQIYNNESIVMGTRQANTMINSCMLCGLCKEICPEDFPMAEVCLQARRTLVDTGTMPPSAHEFALRDMAFANGPKAALVRHAPGEDSSEYVFFPGCQLTASDPENVEAAYADLRKRLGKVGLMLLCCSAPAEWSGRQALMNEAMDDIKQQWKALGSPRIIVSCPTCLKTLRQGLPEAEVSSHWSLFRALGLPESAAGQNTSLAINDPCAARHDTVLLEDVRDLLEQLGVSVVEPKLSGQYTECCGYGGLLDSANPELGKAVRERRSKAAEEDFVTYCAMCRDMLAKTGKHALHFYDLLYPGRENAGARPSPGYSARRENRARLKEKLLADLWREAGQAEKAPFESVAVEFTETALQNMEERRILKGDVQKVLLQTQKTGKRFVHKETGHFLASHRPVIVTYWVEYEEKNGGFLVHNTWSHRMHVRGAGS